MGKNSNGKIVDDLKRDNEILATSYMDTIGILHDKCVELSETKGLLDEARRAVTKSRLKLIELESLIEGEICCDCTENGCRNSHRKCLFFKMDEIIRNNK